MKTLAGLIIALVIGWAVGHFTHSPQLPVAPAPQSCPPVAPSASAATPKPDCSAELEAAAQVYGDAFTLFLASLGVGLAPEHKSELAKLLSDPSEYSPAQLPAAKTEVVAANTTPPAVDAHEQKLATLKQEIRRYTNRENFDDRGFIQHNLKHLLARPALTLGESRYIENYPALSRLNGSYNGTLILMRGKNQGQRDHIALSIQFEPPPSQSKEEEVEGTFHLTLSREGEVYSDARGSGGNGRIKLGPDEQILIEGGPGSFFQFTKKDLTEANYYIDGEFQGMARLWRY